MPFWLYKFYPSLLSPWAMTRCAKHYITKNISYEESAVTNFQNLFCVVTLFSSLLEFIGASVVSFYCIWFLSPLFVGLTCWMLIPHPNFINLMLEKIPKNMLWQRTLILMKLGVPKVKDNYRGTHLTALTSTICRSPSSSKSSKLQLMS